MSVSYSNDFGPRAGFASWLRADGSRRYVPATTLCWFPRKPQRLRARREGYETTIRCGDCPGCREFEVLRLERRLVATYAAAAAAGEVQPAKKFSAEKTLAGYTRPRLFAVRVYCPKDQHASMSRRIHRWSGVEIEAGFFRAGVESFVVLASSPAELGSRLRRRRLRFHVRPVGNLARRRSWRQVARGLIVARSAYGEDINRFYRRGLAPAAKEHFEVYKIDNYRSFDRNRDPRATSQRLGNLVPPEVLELQRGVRLRMRRPVRGATSPEKVDALMPDLLALVRRVGRPLVVSAIPKTPEEIARSRRAYEHVARLESARTDDPKSAKSPPPSFEEEVTELLANSSPSNGQHMSSIHSSGAPPPRTRDEIREEAVRVEAAEKARKDFHAQRTKKKLDEAIARLRELVERNQGK